MERLQTLPSTNNGESAEGRLLEQHLNLSHINVSLTIEVLKNQQLQKLLKQQQLQMQLQCHNTATA